VPVSFEVRYVDGSRDLVEADYHEQVDDEHHFVTTVGASGEERVVSIACGRVAEIVETPIR